MKKHIKYLEETIALWKSLCAEEILERQELEAEVATLKEKCKNLSSSCNNLHKSITGVSIFLVPKKNELDNVDIPNVLPEEF